MLIGLMMASLVAQADPSAADREFFEAKVRPLLVQKCQGCHGPEKQKGELRLDSRAGVLKGGSSGPAVVPGNVEESVLIEAINYGDFVQMPPKSKLPASEIDVLTRWVKSGAYWPEDQSAPEADPSRSSIKAFDLEQRARHWSFQTVRRVEPPEVKDTSWPITDIDRFVLARLEAKGLKPNPDADRRTLLRRVTFDLIGLPPSPSEIAEFLADTSPQAYEKVVERLLASPHYGERWGRHWLDLVRFAETSGHEFDYDIPNAWQYRDYVVRALNADVPYDQFLREHLAGDLLETPRRHPETGINESVIATGFYFLGEGTHSPVDVREDEVLRIDNQIDVIAKSFLGLTVSCARCHDHKFDAISTKDYYAMAGYLQSSRHQQAFIDRPDRIGAPVAALRGLKSEIREVRDRTLDAGTAERYARAAAEVLRSPIAEDAGAILFDDFEGDRYERWTATGTAFGDGPIHLPVPDYQGDVKAHGKGLVGSHNGRVPTDVAGRDALVGTLTSDEFVIERNFLHALIGGGSHQGRTCLNVLVNGQVVRSATGQNNNVMAPVILDLSPWKGQKARLQVVDAETGGWGNISVDHLVFRDFATPEESASRLVPALARREGLDATLLGRWVEALRMRPAVSTLRSDFVLEDFNHEGWGDWSVTGQAFGDSPSRADEFLIGETGPQAVPSGVAHSGLIARPLMGVLRSPTISLDRRYLHVRTWGQSGVINVVIDGFEKIRAPIYGGLTARVNSETPSWVTLDVGMWKDHRAYLEIGDGATLDYSGGNTVAMPGNGYIAVDEIRFSDSPSADASTTSQPAVTPETPEPWRVFAMAENLLPENPELLSLTARYREIEQTIPSPSLVPAILDGTPEDERVHIRGSSKTLGDVVPRRFLEAIAGADQASPSVGSGRLELAEKMLDPSCPLPARVMVNRLWKGHYGVGLVKSTDDFGLMGEPPSNPELLDWLASEFRDGGWSIKKIHRQMVLSRTYRMTSQLDPGIESLDPDNRLLHRMNPRRLEAESIRDAMLAVSGRLDPTIGGPSIMPQITPFMEGRGRPSRSGPLDSEGRRSLYINVRRNFLSPMMLAFDFPAPASTMGRRNVSNVPAQALVLMNDPFVIDQARLWAERLLASPLAMDDPSRIALAYEQAFARPPSPAELEDARLFLAQYVDRPRPEAWADLAHVLFNVKEFVFVP